jgi:hypothetical protein
MKEKNIPEPKGMEKHYGYNDYKKMVETGSLKPGDEVFTFHRLPRGVNSLYTYVVVDKDMIERGPEVFDCRERFKGIDWYVRKAESESK